MISRNYFFSCKVLSASGEAVGYRSMSYHTTRKSWVDDSKSALNYCVDQAKKEAAEHGYTGALIIFAFNRV